MKKLPRDLSTFETIITQNYLYVDKTEHIYNLYATGDRYHFLSRPRRFGKSLLISTLKALFSGKKDLFEGLWIGSSDYHWQEYPIIHIDFAAISDRTPHSLQEGLNNHLDEIAQSHGIATQKETLPEEKLGALIEGLAGHNKVVVLIDEYNYSLIGHLANISLAQEYEKILKNFYGILKGYDASLHAIFITGVSKFSKSSIFAGINNLIDIGMSSVSTNLLGFTDQEIQHYFHDHVSAFAQAKQKSPQDIMHEMKTWYDGYRFGQEKASLHNPFAVLYYLQEQELRNYWYESGVPLLLVTLLNKQLESLDAIGSVELSAETLDVFDINNIPLITLLFQTGYLTIKNYNTITNKFTLNYPNEYIADAFKKNVIEALAHTNVVIIEQSLVALKKALAENNLEQFCATLQTLFTYIPEKLSNDPVHYFYVILKFLFNLLAAKFDSKINKAKDSIELMVTNHQYAYAFKIFFNTSFEEQKESIQRFMSTLVSAPEKVLVCAVIIGIQQYEGVTITHKES